MVTIHTFVCVSCSKAYMDTPAKGFYNNPNLCWVCPDCLAPPTKKKKYDGTFFKSLKDVSVPLFKNHKQKGDKN